MMSTTPPTHSPLPQPVAAEQAPIVLVDNYDSFTYNLYQMVQAQTTAPVLVVRNDQYSYEALLALNPQRFILSPGPGHPDIAKDFGVCREILQRHMEHGRPVLGVCLGHQGLASAFGGRVVQAPTIVHGKTSPVAILNESPLLADMPNPFEAMRYHSLVVEEATLPQGLTILAKDLQHHLIMALQHDHWPLYGVQFHPESIGTPAGAQLLKNFIERC